MMDLAVLGLIVLVVLVVGIGIGAAIAPRIDRRMEREEGADGRDDTDA